MYIIIDQFDYKLGYWYMSMNKKMAVSKYYKRNSATVKADIAGEWSHFTESSFLEIENIKHYCIPYL